MIKIKSNQTEKVNYRIKIGYRIELNLKGYRYSKVARSRWNRTSASMHCSYMTRPFLYL